MPTFGHGVQVHLRVMKLRREPHLVHVTVAHEQHDALRVALLESHELLLWRALATSGGAAGAAGAGAGAEVATGETTHAMTRTPDSPLHVVAGSRTRAGAGHEGEIRCVQGPADPGRPVRNAVRGEAELRHDGGDAARGFRAVRSHSATASRSGQSDGQVQGLRVRGVRAREGLRAGVQAGSPQGG
ncbi:hypothetical protein ON010_g18247 [Phytophthora cinnamomi]|nr:hypothetical protein ON010_g18247 [Phytophthora cinnamomi]